MWIEIFDTVCHDTTSLKSRPARALWIEILESERLFKGVIVEAREGLVD